jgi:DNA-binding beta-propeller fold protein YncE
MLGILSKLVTKVSAYLYPPEKKEEDRLSRIAGEIKALVDDYLTSVLTTMVMEYLGKREAFLRQWTRDLHPKELPRQSYAITYHNGQVFDVYCDRVNITNTKGDSIQYLGIGQTIRDIAVTDHCIYMIDQRIQVCDEETLLNVSISNNEGFRQGRLLIPTDPSHTFWAQNIAISPISGTIILHDGLGYIKVLDAKRQLITQWTLPGWKEDGKCDVLSRMAISYQEEIYFTDVNNHCIYAYDLNGRLIRQWGRLGSGEGEFNEPRGITARGNELFVADTKNHRIQVFDLEGNYLRQSSDRIVSPVGITISPSGELFATDDEGKRVVVLRSILDINPGIEV